MLNKLKVALVTIKNSFTNHDTASTKSLTGKDIANVIFILHSNPLYYLNLAYKFNSNVNRYDIWHTIEILNTNIS